MRVMVRRFLVLMFAVATAGAPQAPATGQYSLRGIVVNGATGEPVPRALVRLNMTAPKMALSGPDGRFQFDDLPPSGAIVHAQRARFYTPQEMGLSTASLCPDDRSEKMRPMSKSTCTRAQASRAA